MDYNGLIPIQGTLGIGAMPIGVIDAVAMDDRLMNSYNGLTETAKEHLILRYKDAKNDEERREILKVLLPDEDSVRAINKDMDF